MRCPQFGGLFMPPPAPGSLGDRQQRYYSMEPSQAPANPREAMRNVLAELYDLHLSIAELQTLWGARQAMAKIHSVLHWCVRNGFNEYFMSETEYPLPYKRVLEGAIKSISAQPVVQQFDVQAKAKERSPLRLLASMDGDKYRRDKQIEELTYHGPAFWP